MGDDRLCGFDYRRRCDRPFSTGRDTSPRRPTKCRRRTRTPSPRRVFDRRCVPTNFGKKHRVLPLENLSEEKENAFFADGIQDELLSNLSKIKDLKVISRTSVMKYKRAITRNLSEIARQMGVSTVVIGSVSRAGK